MLSDHQNYVCHHTRNDQISNCMLVFHWWVEGGFPDNWGDIGNIFENNWVTLGTWLEYIINGKGAKKNPSLQKKPQKKKKKTSCVHGYLSHWAAWKFCSFLNWLSFSTWFSTILSKSFTFTHLNFFTFTYILVYIYIFLHLHEANVNICQIHLHGFV